MKFTLFALLAAFCVLSVNAGTWQPLVMSSDVGMEYESNEFADVEGDFMEPETFLIWGILKRILRCVKGFNCVLKWVVGIKASATQYSDDITACGVEASKEVTALLNTNVKIIQTANNIINLKTNVCATAENGKKPSITNFCTVRTLRQVIRLYVQVKRAIRQSKKIPTIGPNATTCVTNATNTLVSYYTNFVNDVTSCSKLIGS
ncbi:uncharacterized protein LOC117790297 [Drosophila innubila]|uniref:uncharacterized protein LOC117790297 n=1 Tax=Drosophila innubila TaxID=198719 RepID=UPI00148C408F|nr:uncharacterized protein LOC117790297 [Drosophila innubila]